MNCLQTIVFVNFCILILGLVSGFSLAGQNPYSASLEGIKFSLPLPPINSDHLLAQSTKTRKGKHKQRRSPRADSNAMQSAPLRRGGDIRPTVGIWTGTNYKGSTIFLFGGDYAMHNGNIVYLGGLLYGSFSDKGETEFGDYTATLSFIAIDGGMGYKIGLNKRSWFEAGGRIGVDLASYKASFPEPDPGSFFPLSQPRQDDSKEMFRSRSLPGHILDSRTLNETVTDSETFVTLSPYLGFSYLLQKNIGLGAEIRKPVAISGGKDSIEIEGFYFLAKMHYIMK